jgi:hypothetical protein
VLTEYQQFALATASPVLLILVMIFVVYLIVSRGATFKRRFETAAHTLLVILASLYAIVVAPYSGHLTGLWVVPFGLLLLAFLVSLIYSFTHFEGSRFVHLCQLLELPCAAYVFFIGLMTISHDWL